MWSPGEREGGAACRPGGSLAQTAEAASDGPAGAGAEAAGLLPDGAGQGSPPLPGGGGQAPHTHAAAGLQIFSV